MVELLEFVKVQKQFLLQDQLHTGQMLLVSLYNIPGETAIRDRSASFWILLQTGMILRCIELILSLLHFFQYHK